MDKLMNCCLMTTVVAQFRDKRAWQWQKNRNWQDSIQHAPVLYVSRIALTYYSQVMQKTALIRLDNRRQVWTKMHAGVLCERQESHKECLTRT